MKRSLTILVVLAAIIFAVVLFFFSSKHQKTPTNAMAPNIKVNQQPEVVAIDNNIFPSPHYEFTISAGNPLYLVNVLNTDKKDVVVTLTQQGKSASHDFTIKPQQKFPFALDKGTFYFTIKSSNSVTTILIK